MSLTPSPGAGGQGPVGFANATPYGLVKAYKSYVAAAGERTTPSPVRGRGLLQHIRKAKEKKAVRGGSRGPGQGERQALPAGAAAQEVALLEEERVQLHRQHSELEKAMAVLKEKLDVTKAQRRHYQKKSANLATTVREQGELIGVLEMAKLDAIGSVAIDDHLCLKERNRALEEQLGEAREATREVSENAVSEAAQLTAEIASLRTTLLRKEEELDDEITQNEELQKRYTLAGALGTLSPKRPRATAAAMTQTPPGLLADAVFTSQADLVVSLEATTRQQLETLMAQLLKRLHLDGQQQAAALARLTTHQNEQHKAHVAGLADCNNLLKLKIQKLERQLANAARQQEELSTLRTEVVRERSEKSRVVSQNALLEDRLRVTQELLDHLKHESEGLKADVQKKANLISGLETQVGELKKVSESKAKDLALIRDLKQQQQAIQEETASRSTLFFDFSEEVLAISRAERMGLMQSLESNARDQEQTELRQLMQEQQEQMAILMNTVNGLNAGRMRDDGLERVDNAPRRTVREPAHDARGVSQDHTALLDPGQSASAPISEHGEATYGKSPAGYGDLESGGSRLKLTERSLAELAKAQQTPNSLNLVRRSLNLDPKMGTSRDRGIPVLKRSLSLVLQRDVNSLTAAILAGAVAAAAAGGCAPLTLDGGVVEEAGRYGAPDNMTPDDAGPDTETAFETMGGAAQGADDDVDDVLKVLGPEQMVSGDLQLGSTHEDDLAGGTDAVAEVGVALSEDAGGTPLPDDAVEEALENAHPPQPALAPCPPAEPAESVLLPESVPDDAVPSTAGDIDVALPDSGPAGALIEPEHSESPRDHIADAAGSVGVDDEAVLAEDAPSAGSCRRADGSPAPLDVDVVGEDAVEEPGAFDALPAGGATPTRPPLTPPLQAPTLQVSDTPPRVAEIRKLDALDEARPAVGEGDDEGSPVQTPLLAQATEFDSLVDLAEAGASPKRKEKKRKKKEKEARKDRDRERGEREAVEEPVSPAAAGQAAVEAKKPSTKEERKERRKKKKEAAAAAAAAEKEENGSKGSRGTLDPADAYCASLQEVQKTNSSSLKFETPVSTPAPSSPLENTVEMAPLSEQDAPLSAFDVPASTPARTVMNLADPPPPMDLASNDESYSTRFDLASTAVPTSPPPTDPLRRSSSGKVHPMLAAPPAVTSPASTFVIDEDSLVASPADTGALLQSTTDAEDVEFELGSSDGEGGPPPLRASGGYSSAV
eukprot:TRINITY_DN374_c2_g1_i1.p1 TRINITY_DN374_c2_g1~~TRINITY_DN374_c2_g1_i1.p1  ORF type:complete len:1232 (+),score=457.62 TRINITY_DN374_c2_g1_i1:63-3758(+)